MRSLTIVLGVVALSAIHVGAQVPDARQVAQERAQAELEVPKLVEVLGLKPGMTVADIGAGGGAFTVVLGHWIGGGKVLATDIGPRQLKEIREYADKEGLKNVTVIEGAAAATNLPVSCCEAMVMRNVYHHITTASVEGFNKSVLSSLKPGGYFAVIDFQGPPGSAIPEGVSADRRGHGIPPEVVVTELAAAGLTHVRTIESWPPGAKQNVAFLVLFQK